MSRNDTASGDLICFAGGQLTRAVSLSVFSRRALSRGAWLALRDWREHSVFKDIREATLHVIDRIRNNHVHKAKAHAQL